MGLNEEAEEEIACSMNYFEQCLLLKSPNISLLPNYVLTKCSSKYHWVIDLYLAEVSLPL